MWRHKKASAARATAAMAVVLVATLTPTVGARRDAIAAPTAPAASAASASTVSAAIGARLFNGDIGLLGRLRHHDQDLPSAVLACANCHDPQRRAGAVPVTGGVLMRARPRLGGPAVAYDAPALCRLLRTGVAANHVLVDGLMPRYNIPDPHCQALWAYLVAVPAGTPARRP